MAVVMGADGQLINTSNIGGVGASLIPNLAPNIGALANVGGSVIPSGVTNDDGTITLPTIEMKTRDPRLALGEMQKIYGTKYMPMFQFIEAQQTGTYTYDPTDDNMMSPEELDTIRQEFEAEHGMSADQALQMAQIERAGQKVAGATAGKVAGAFAQSRLGNAGYGEAALDAAGSVVPFKSLFKEPTAPINTYMIDGVPSTNEEALIASKIGGSEISRIPTSERDVPKQSAMVTGLDVLRGNEDTGIMDRLYGGSEANMANLKMTGYAAGADFITQIAMGADPMDAAKDAGKTAVLSYVANAIIPGSGAVVGFLSKFF